jgi:MFS family permease
MSEAIEKNRQYYKFGLYGFLKNLRFYESFLILFFLEKGIDYLKIGLLYSIREITIILLEIPSGLAADVLGRKRTLMASFLFYMVSFVIFYFSSHFFLMALAMIFFAIADAFRTGIHKAMIFQYLKSRGKAHQKADYYGHTRSWSQTGSALSSLIAAAMVFYYGSYKIIFAASVVPYVFDFILISTYPDFLNGEIKHIGQSTLWEKSKYIFSAFYQNFKNLEFLRSLTSLSLHTGYYRAVKDYIQPIMMSLALTIPFFTGLENKQKTALVVGILYFFIYLFTAYASRRSGRFMDFYKNYSRPMNLTLLIGFVAGIVSGIFYAIQLFWISALFFILILMIENLRKPIGISYVAELSHDDAMATALSVQSQSQSLFAALIAPIVGVTAQYAGVGIGMAVATTFLLLFFPLYRLKEI